MSEGGLRVLALEPYYGGSHRAVLDQWAQRSRHRFELLTLPARHWKWRMRHAAVTFAQQIRQRLEEAQTVPWDVVFASDMLALAELRGLLPPAAGHLPMVLYFHESQLEYPSRFAHQGDLHFAMTNLTSALAAEAVWFNSRFHLEAFFSATEALLERMPDYQPLGRLASLRSRCSVQYPGVEAPAGPLGALDVTRCEQVEERVLRIVWAARWEHDKNPDAFFRALRELSRRGNFRLAVLGAGGDQVPECFAAAKVDLAAHIDEWGYVASAARYGEILARSDVFVSTAMHEFFGVAAVEAMCHGCAVLLPNRLAYPELVGGEERWLYGSEEELVERLAGMAASPSEARTPARALAEQARRRFTWSQRCPEFDRALAEVRVRGRCG